MASYKNNRQKLVNNDESSESGQFLKRDIFTHILQEQYNNKQTLQNWLKRDYLHQQLFLEK